MKYTLIVSIALIALVACTSLPTTTPTTAITITVTPIITATTVPTTTPTSSPRPQNTPATEAATATAIAKVPEVLPGIPVPSADLLKTTPDSPIGQYAKVMGLDPNAVKGEITFQQKTDVNGNKFAVAVAKDGTPLIIWENGEWKSVTIRNFSDLLKINSGTLLEGAGSSDFNDLIKVQATNFNYGMVITDQGLSKGPNQIDYGYSDYEVKMGVKNRMPLMSHMLVWPKAVPDWLTKGNYSNEQIMDIMTQWITTTMQRYPQIKVWEVVNEAYDNDFFQKKLGDDYVIKFFQIARKARPDATLIYNDYANHSTSDANFPNGQRTQLTSQIVERLKKENLIDGVGVEMIIYADNVPSNEDISSTLKSYGLPVYVTEFQVIMTNIAGSQQQRWLKQAEIYRNVVDAILKSGNCKTIIFFNQSDKRSPWQKQPELPQYSAIANPTLFDDNFQPKPAYFAVLAALLSEMQQ